MLLPTGVFVAVPLTLLQSAAHHLHDGQYVQDLHTMIPLNMMLAHSVYDWDRHKHEGRFVESTNVCLVWSSCILYEHARLFVPLLVFLYHFYDRCKPIFARGKPFFVAFVWTLAVCTLPVVLEGGNPHEWFSPVSTFLLMSCWSNLADVPDIAEDSTRGLCTPSVTLGVKRSQQLSFILLVLAVIIRLHSPFHDHLECAFDLINLSAFYIVQQQVKEDEVI